MTATIAELFKEYMAKMPDTFDTKKEIDLYFKDGLDSIVMERKAAVKADKTAKAAEKFIEKAKKEENAAKAAKAAKATHITMMSIDEVNTKILKDICYETIEKLSDANLMPEYTESSSVKNEITKLSDILKRHIDDDDKIQGIIKDYLLQLIPAGTKGVIRGNKFNKIVKEYIILLDLDKSRFEVCFEKKSAIRNTTEIPDWYILDKSNNRILIGMNQLDLWSGGHQTNRGAKYIDIEKKIKEDNSSSSGSNSKLLCVVCYEKQFKSDKNKTYKLFVSGIENNTLCYLKNLSNIIRSYFAI